MGRLFGKPIAGGFWEVQDLEREPQVSQVKLRAPDDLIAVCHPAEAGLMSRLAWIKVSAAA